MSFKHNIGIVLQARTGSTRLPKKMTLPFYEGKGILETILIRIKNASFEIPIVLSTTTKPSDDVLVEIAKKYEIPVFRGSEQNVLDRFIQTGETFNFDKIIRICSDNPFIDLEALNYQIEDFQKTNVDYWCYSLSDKTPTIKTHYGFWTEGVKLVALRKVAEETDAKLYLEHVTNYIYSNPHKFNIHFEPINKGIEDKSNMRLTIDTQQDFDLSQLIYRRLYDKNIPFTAKGITYFICNKPEYLEVMESEIEKNKK